MFALLRPPLPVREVGWVHREALEGQGRQLYGRAHGVRSTVCTLKGRKGCSKTNRPHGRTEPVLSPLFLLIYLLSCFTLSACIEPPYLAFGQIPAFPPPIGSLSSSLDGTTPPPPPPPTPDRPRQRRLDSAVVGREANDPAPHPALRGSLGRRERRGMVPNVLHGVRLCGRGRAGPTLGPRTLYPGPHRVYGPEREGPRQVGVATAKHGRLGESKASRDSLHLVRRGGLFRTFLPSPPR